MTPEQKLKWAVLAKVAEWNKELPPEYPCANVDELYDALVEADAHWDGKSEVRSGEAETCLPCDWSRHYESKAVAMKMPDGSWVGWTYWYGGGKHGEPGAIDWMGEAYAVDCQEEEKTLIVQTFSKPETANVEFSGTPAALSPEAPLERRVGGAVPPAPTFGEKT